MEEIKFSICCVLNTTYTESDFFNIFGNSQTQTQYSQIIESGFKIEESHNFMIQIVMIHHDHMLHWY